VISLGIVNLTCVSSTPKQYGVRRAECMNLVRSSVTSSASSQVILGINDSGARTDIFRFRILKVVEGRTEEATTLLCKRLSEEQRVKVRAVSMDIGLHLSPTLEKSIDLHRSFLTVSMSVSLKIEQEIMFGGRKTSLRKKRDATLIGTTQMW
jgi:hypothetical protein